MESRMTRNRMKAALAAASTILTVALGCHEGGGGSSTAPPSGPQAPAVRYLQVEGTWEGAWLIEDVVPVNATLHLEQSGADVRGTLWMNDFGTPAHFELSGVAGEDDGSGNGVFAWSAAGSGDSIDCPMTLDGLLLNGTLSRSRDGVRIQGPISLYRP